MIASLIVAFFHRCCSAFSVVQQGQLWGKLKKGEKKSFNSLSPYLCLSLQGLSMLFVFIVTPRDIQLFADRSALERGHFTFAKHLLLPLPNAVILQCFIFRATGSNDERSKWKDVRPNGAERDKQIESQKTNLIANFWQKNEKEEKSGKAKQAL